MLDDGRDPEVARLLDCFRHAPIRPADLDVAGPCTGLAQQMASVLADGEELVAGLECLWRAREWFSRAERRRPTGR